MTPDWKERDDDVAAGRLAPTRLWRISVESIERCPFGHLHCCPIAKQYLPENRALLDWVLF